MSKARIRKITNKDTEIISKINDYEEQSTYFTLIDKEGNVAKNDQGHAIIYKAALPEAGMEIIEAYSYLMYWAEEECSFKKFTPLELLTKDFTKGDIVIPEGTIFERENYKQEFDELMNAKALRKLRKSMVDFHECLDDMNKRINKFAEYLEDLDDRRQNPDIEIEDDEEDLEEEEDEEFVPGTDDEAEEDMELI